MPICGASVKLKSLSYFVFGATPVESKMQDIGQSVVSFGQIGVKLDGNYCNHGADRYPTG